MPGRRHQVVWAADGGEKAENGNFARRGVEDRGQDGDFARRRWEGQGQNQARRWRGLPRRDDEFVKLGRRWVEPRDLVKYPKHGTVREDSDSGRKKGCIMM